MIRSTARIACLSLVVMTHGGCSSASDMPQAALLAASQEAVNPQANNRRLFYIGLALYSEPWSENDVVELADELRRTSALEVVPLIASNLVSARGTFPLADDATITRLVDTAAERARPDDIMVVHISTHGARGVLASRIGNRAPTALGASQLRRQLAPLVDKRTVVIISACYSGSLIAPLASPRRVIITAARADRSSFGCGAGNRHTFFGEAELRGFAERDRSLHQVFATIRDEVARMERERHYTPSEPQVSIGADATDLYDAPLF